MSTIRERSGKFLGDLHKNAGYGRVVCNDDLVKFAESERALQRQECAEAVRLWLTDDDAGIEMGAWWDELNKSILAAGVEPTNPFGCRCEWKRDDHHNRHVLWRGEVYFYSTSCDFCPSCGKAKRREQ